MIIIDLVSILVTYLFVYFCRKLYAQHHRNTCKAQVGVTEAGLHVNHKIPFLGTSVDGVVDCPTCGLGIVEIKCPYGTKQNKWRNMTVTNCCTDSNFCCELDSSNNISLKKNHSYYYQIIGQMALTSAKYCDFVVYTRKGINVQRVIFDKVFWLEMQPKLVMFYRHMVAEIMSSRILRGKLLYP